MVVNMCCSHSNACPTHCDPMDSGTQALHIHGISLAESWSGLLFSSQRIFHHLQDCGISCFLCLLRAQAGSLPSATVEARWWKRWLYICQKWVLSLPRERCHLKQVLFPRWAIYNPPASCSSA